MTRRWWVLGVLCLAELVVVLDNTVLNVAVPVLATRLAADTADVQWTINAYALAQAGLLLAAGSAADRYGRRRMLLLGLAVFGAGSLAAGLAGSVAQLVAARAVMGVGGALLITGTLAVAIQVFDAAERPRAIAIWAAVNALGFAAGPLIGGVILAHFHWGAIFLLNVPLALAGLAAVRALVPESRNPARGRPDLPGAALATLGTTAVVYAIIAGAPLFLLGGALVLGGFLAWERYTRNPMLSPELFGNRRFVGAVTGVVLITFGSAGALFLLTLQLQFVRGYAPLEAGLRIAPFALSVVVLTATGIGPALIRRLGIPLAIAAGMTLLAAGLAAVAFAGAGYGGLLTGLLLMGAGCALANPAIVEAVVGAVPADDAGAGAGVEGTMTELGSSLGVAVLGALMQARFTALLPAAGSLPAALSAASPAAERAPILDALAAGLRLGQGVGAAAVLAGGWLAALLLWSGGPDTAAPLGGEREHPGRGGTARD
ncbi:MFS transporter [Dactylosporangium sp. CA-139114]|uniref:MFS transporter n=1 Tax=Dactylosporangium sp. CA-139114 TaxID=3239931 RepID=UPI003D96A6D3